MAVYRQETKYRARCDVHGCMNIASHYIGHGSYVHTGYRLCDDCWGSILQQAGKPPAVKEVKEVPVNASMAAFARVAEEHGVTLDELAMLVSDAFSRKAEPMQEAEEEHEAWNEYDNQLDAMDADELEKVKAHKLRTYANIKYDLTFKVGTTKKEMVQEIMLARGE